MRCCSSADRMMSREKQLISQEPPSGARHAKPPLENAHRYRSAPIGRRMRPYRSPQVAQTRAPLQELISYDR
jgi:hypothetical protein